MWLNSPNIKGYLLKPRLLIYLFHCCGSGRGSILIPLYHFQLLAKIVIWTVLYLECLSSIFSCCTCNYLISISTISIWLNISCILLVHFMLDVIYFSLANSQLELTLFTTQAQKNMFRRYFRNLFWSAIDFIFP